MRLFRILALGVAIAGAALSAHAQTAQPVVPGYISTSCQGASPCFVPYSGQNTLNITASTVVKATAGRLVRVSVIVAGGSAGGCYDVATTGAAAQANQILAIPTTATAGTVYFLDFPTSAGIVCMPGSSGVLAVAYD